jgi:hypothetical protein
LHAETRPGASRRAAPLARSAGRSLGRGARPPARGRAGARRAGAAGSRTPRAPSTTRTCSRWTWGRARRCRRARCWTPCWRQCGALRRSVAALRAPTGSWWCSTGCLPPGPVVIGRLPQPRPDALWCGQRVAAVCRRLGAPSTGAGAFTPAGVPRLSCLQDRMGGRRRAPQGGGGRAPALTPRAREQGAGRLRCGVHAARAAPGPGRRRVFRRAARRPCAARAARLAGGAVRPRAALSARPEGVRLSRAGRAVCAQAPALPCRRRVLIPERCLLCILLYGSAGRVWKPPASAVLVMRTMSVCPLAGACTGPVLCTLCCS